MRIEKFLISFLLFFSNTTKPPFEDLSNFCTECVPCNTYILSPLHGAVGAEGEFLKNVWLYYDCQSSMVQLLKTFCIVEDGDEFLATTYQPYSRFTPSTIALFISKAYDNSLFNREKDEHYSAIKEIVTTFNGPGNPTRLHHCINLIKEALNEETEGLFPEGTTFQILLAFLYLRSDTTNDLKNYSDALSAYLKNNVTHMCGNTAWNPDISRMLIQKIFQKKDVRERPPALSWKRKVQYKNNKPISNCCETVVREFLNGLLFDPETQQFNCERLPEKIRKKIPLATAYFYSNHTSAHLDAANNQQAHEDWMHVVSDLANIEYRRETHEINPDLINIMHCLASICGINFSKNKFLSTEALLRWLCQKLSNDSLYTLKFKDYFYKKDMATLFFEISYIKNQEISNHTFTLYIKKDHAWIKHTTNRLEPSHQLIENAVVPVSLDYLIAERIKEEQLSDHSKALHDLSTVYATHLLDNSNHDLERHKLMLFNLPTDSDTQKQYCFKKLLAYHKQTHDHAIFTYILSILKSLSNSRKLGQCLYEILFDYYGRSEIKKIIKKNYCLLNKPDQQALMLRCAQKKLWQDKRYKKIMLAVLGSLENYHVEGPLIFDNKVYVLQKLFLCKAQKDPTLLSMLKAILKTLSPGRQERFQKGLTYAKNNKKSYLSASCI